MRIALVYDCLYPRTVGGAERWLRALAEHLAAGGHDVTYVTRRQWARGEHPIEGVRCVAVAPGGPLYAPDGRRRLGPPLRFGTGVLRHFLRHRRDYDVVHCLSYPFLPLAAIRLALTGRRPRPRLYCEWLECLTRAYWRAYGGPLGGALAHALQGLCVCLTPEALCFSGLVESRLRESGFEGPVHRLGGLAEEAAAPPAPPAQPPYLLFAGRHVPDKRVTLIPDVLLAVRRTHPQLRAVVVGDGPERPRLLERVERLKLDGALSAPGFVSQDELRRLMAGAACIVSPSVRDGWGMAVAEAAALGTPAVVAPSPDSAATELVEEGTNGALAGDGGAEALAAATLRVLDAGEPLRRSSAAWFAANRERLSLERSLERIQAVYRTERRRT